ncbi:hypothetical protein QJQ45_022284 [Haematococcus lacustris]|nr:hypothetical protein QJQ45_022284 [Haematococcus lacustris]
MSAFVVWCATGIWTLWLDHTFEDVMLSYSIFRHAAVAFCQHWHTLRPNTEASWELCSQTTIFEPQGVLYLRMPALLLPGQPPVPGPSPLRPLADTLPDEITTQAAADEASLPAEIQPAAPCLELHAVWHPTYQVPTLFLRGWCQGGRVMSLADLAEALPGWQACKARAAAEWAFLSPEAHPLLPGTQASHWYMLHPCQTAQLLQTMLGDGALPSTQPPPPPSAKPTGAEGGMQQQPTQASVPRARQWEGAVWSVREGLQRLNGLPSVQQSLSEAPEAVQQQQLSSELLSAGQCGPHSSMEHTSPGGQLRGARPTVVQQDVRAGLGRAEAEAAKIVGGRLVCHVEDGSQPAAAVHRFLLRYMVAWFSAVVSPVIAVHVTVPALP